MDKQSTITLQCVRANGRRELTQLTTDKMSEARELAKSVLRTSRGIYTEVDICSDDGVETVRNTPRSMDPSQVLLVDDNPGDALLVGQALAEGPTRVHLRIARDGEQALEMLNEPDFNPNLIILDLNMPRVSGYTVLAAHPVEKAPVVVFSASHNQADVGRALSLGAKEFVHKPLDLDDYKTAVNGMVQKWAYQNFG
jgi:CheY-like chemotaxis protein